MMNCYCCSSGKKLAYTDHSARRQRKNKKTYLPLISNVLQMTLMKIHQLIVLNCIHDSIWAERHVYGF